jgi:predicted ATPase
VFQLRYPALPADFPPLKTLNTFPNNLPAQLTSFIGREKEIEAARSLLAKTRLLTFTGSGGSGKTRLALQVGAEVLEEYTDGVWLVELAALTEPGLLSSTVAQALGVKEQPGQTVQKMLLDSLKSKSRLLLLDNCEHFLSACAQLVAVLLRSCPNIKVLATSREALGIGGEQSYRVPSLTSPDPKQKATPESLSQYEAVRLFIDRACSHKPDFAVTNANAPALAQLCYQLDGIPLALELAAARVRSLSVEDINTRLDHRFRLLTGGDRAALPRHQTLRALIDWSYDLLTGQEKALLGRLCVFAGGWTLAAAEQVGAKESIEEWAVFDLLTSLADKSLALVEERGGSARYRFLETVRQYGRERLMESGEQEAVGKRHRDYFLAFAAAAEPQLIGADQGEWSARLEAEYENLRAGLEWSLGEGNATACLRFCGALWRYWWTRGHYAEGREWCVRSLVAVGSKERTRERSAVLTVAGILANFQGDYASARAYHEESLMIEGEIGSQHGIATSLSNLGSTAFIPGNYASARSYYEESLTICRNIGDQSGIAIALCNLGTMARIQDDYASARACYEESMMIEREIGDRNGIATLLGNLGILADDQGDYASAHVFYEESLTIFREIGSPYGIATSLSNLGSVAFIPGDYASARAYHEESLTIFRNIGDQSGIAIALSNLGNVAHIQDDYASASACYEESLTIRREIGHRSGIAESLEEFASLSAQESRTKQAAALWGAAAALREQIGAPLPPSDRETYERDVAQARQVMGEEAFTAAWEEGRAMTIEKAVEYALREEK